MALSKLWLDAVRGDESVVEMAVSNCIGRFGHATLKAAQAEAIVEILKGHDVFVSVPTGYGKSLVYQILPFCVAKILDAVGKKHSLTPCVLVLSPLTALMSDQNNKMKTVTGAKPLLLAKDQQLHLMSMEWTHIFASPETLFDTEKGRQLLLSESFVHSLVAVAIDEAHCIVKWGLDSSFRVWYGKVAQIRSFILNSTPIVALTATATTRTSTAIIKHMRMAVPRIVHISPNRSNIRYSVVESSRECTTAFQWLLDDLQKKRKNANRVLVYCRSIGTCTRLYKFFLTSLQHLSYEPPFSPPGIVSRLFAMFHSRVDDNDKSLILDSMKNPDGVCRVVFCTIAFGMGVDIHNIRTVIHYGLPSDIDDYMQESGRGGRDGLECSATLFLYPGSFLGNISPEMKKYAKNKDKCRRELLLQSFPGEQLEKPSHHHSCCDICQQQCSCASPCIYQIEPWEEVNQLDDQSSIVPVRNPTPEQLSVLRIKLLELRETVLRCDDGKVPTLFVGRDIASGLPSSVIDNIIDNIAYIDSPDELDMHYVWNYSSQIYDIITDVCDD